MSWLAHCAFEEVAYLLIYGQLLHRPMATGGLSLAALDFVSRTSRSPRKTALVSCCGTLTHPDERCGGCYGVLGCLEPEEAGRDQYHVAEPFAGPLFLSMVLCNWWQFTRQGRWIETQTDDPTIAGQFTASPARQSAPTNCTDGPWTPR